MKILMLIMVFSFLFSGISLATDDEVDSKYKALSSETEEVSGEAETEAEEEKEEPKEESSDYIMIDDEE